MSGGSPYVARALTALALAVSGCGANGHPARSPTSSFAGLPADERPVPAGRGRGFRPNAISAAVARRAPVGGMRCGRAGARPYAVHLELYARGLVLPVPAGIGVAPPQPRRGAYVLGGRCVYPLRTLEPTGVVLVDQRRGPAPSLSALFALWGRPLTRSALAGFRGRVLAFAGGRRWTGPPGAIPLRRHAEIVLEIGGYVIPHRSYRFPPGL